MTPDPTLLNALRQALARDPGNGPLWLHLAQQLEAAGESGEATAALREALAHGAEARATLARLLPLLRAGGQLSEALIRCEQHLATDDDPGLRVELARILAARGDREAALREYERALARDPGLADAVLEGPLHGAAARPAEVPDPDAAEAPGVPPAPAGPRPDPRLASVRPDVDPDADWAADFDWTDLVVKFADVGGLDEVKKQIHRRIIAPFQNRGVYQAFGRKAGGGLLLYGPPGCGKTFIARATAGECNARFLHVGIAEVLDKYYGESERMLHQLFETARAQTPTILFFDEFDALGSSRGKSDSQFWRTLVNQLLQEMDGMAGRNEEVLVFAATNLPWNVDPAFRRPGRFDRMLFVPPPDDAARRHILARHVRPLPGGDRVALDKLIKKTAGFTGADLKGLCERASERALDRSFETGEVHPVETRDFERELKGMQSSAREWIATARNYARYSNEGGLYDDLVEFLQATRHW